MAASSKNYTKQKALNAIEGSGGIISTIAKRLGCSWYTAQQLTKRWPDVTEAYQAEKEQLVDMAETTILQAIKSGDISAAKWYLSTQAKDRGYTERQEITGANGGDVNIKVEWGAGDN